MMNSPVLACFPLIRRRATPGAAIKLRDCVLTPMELLEQWDAFTIHSTYYITKHVNAALQRCLGLSPHHVDVSLWFEASSKPSRSIHYWPSTRSRQNTMMISTFFGSDKCSLCRRKCTTSSRSRAAVCEDCRNDPVQAIDWVRNEAFECGSAGCPVVIKKVQRMQSLL